MADVLDDGTAAAAARVELPRPTPAYKTVDRSRFVVKACCAGYGPHCCGLSEGHSGQHLDIETGEKWDQTAELEETQRLALNVLLRADKDLATLRVPCDADPDSSDGAEKGVGK